MPARLSDGLQFAPSSFRQTFSSTCRGTRFAKRSGTSLLVDYGRLLLLTASVPRATYDRGAGSVRGQLPGEASRSLAHHRDHVLDAPSQLERHRQHGSTRGLGACGLLGDFEFGGPRGWGRGVRRVVVRSGRDRIDPIDGRDFAGWRRRERRRRLGLSWFVRGRVVVPRRERAGGKSPLRERRVAGARRSACSGGGAHAGAPRCRCTTGAARR